jgi:hypothetical protein
VLPIFEKEAKLIALACSKPSEGTRAGRCGRWRTRSWNSASSRAPATAICALIAATASFAILFAILQIDAGFPFDKILLTAVVGATAGAALAWYIPQAAASTKSDPLSVPREERVQTLELATRKRFNNSSAATEWLERRPVNKRGSLTPLSRAGSIVWPRRSASGPRADLQQVCAQGDHGVRLVGAILI